MPNQGLIAATWPTARTSALGSLIPFLSCRFFLSECYRCCFDDSPQLRELVVFLFGAVTDGVVPLFARRLY
ncbi:hypothetical protein EMIT0P253_100148 [Pseudomonas sp. IT-P253]